MHVLGRATVLVHNACDAAPLLLRPAAGALFGVAGHRFPPPRRSDLRSASPSPCCTYAAPAVSVLRSPRACGAAAHDRALYVAISLTRTSTHSAPTSRLCLRTSKCRPLSAHVVPMQVPHSRLALHSPSSPLPWGLPCIVSVTFAQF
eukprot:EG_transcript_23950